MRSNFFSNFRGLVSKKDKFFKTENASMLYAVDESDVFVFHFLCYYSRYPYPGDMFHRLRH